MKRKSQIPVLVSGYQGKMGQETVKAVEAHKDLCLVATVGRGDDLATTIRKTQPAVVVDFTEPACVFAHAETIIAHGVHPVIGTTGLSEEAIAILQEQAEKQALGGLIVPNFSIAAVLMMRYAQDAMPYFQAAEIIEMHHAQKKDAPSGTALKTAAMLRAAGDAESSIPIHSIRLPGLVAHQSVLFGGDGETLTIRHDVLDRRSFMAGVCLACCCVVHLRGLFYGLEHIL